MAQINRINKILSKDDNVKKNDYYKYLQKTDLQLNELNEKINKLIQKN